MTSRTRNMAARAIKKIHVPAYWPLLVGVQVSEKSGVLNEVKKVIIISDMPIMEESELISIEDMDVEVDMDIPVVVAVEVIELMSISIMIVAVDGV